LPYLFLKPNEAIQVIIKNATGDCFHLRFGRESLVIDCLVAPGGIAFGANIAPVSLYT
jgi:hypothetical protein